MSFGDQLQSDGTWKRFVCGTAPRYSFCEEQSVEDTVIPIPTEPKTKTNSIPYALLGHGLIILAFVIIFYLIQR
jgi:hypothetical protein